MSRCEVMNGEGDRCLYLDHDKGRHLFAGDEGADSFLLGKLQSAVSMFLAGTVDRDFLAAALSRDETSVAS